MCDGQTGPHRPRLVVSRSTCPPLSPSPHANRVIKGTTVESNKHAHILVPVSRANAYSGTRHALLSPAWRRRQWGTQVSLTCQKTCVRAEDHHHPWARPWPVLHHTHALQDCLPTGARYNPDWDPQLSVTGPVQCNGDSVSATLRSQMPSSCCSCTILSATRTCSTSCLQCTGSGHRVFITAGPSTSYKAVCMSCHCCLLLQYLIQSCSLGGRRIVEDMCYEIRRAEACVD